MDLRPPVVLEVKPETAIKTERRTDMRKAFSGILAAVIVFSVYAVTAFAAGPRGNRYFADAGGDAVCGSRGTCVYVDADGDGVCDHYAAGQCGGSGRGRNFADADGDGICDNYVSGQGRGGRGFRGGRGG